ncbi:serine hydrolase domain-containing protein [Gryllotalpicola reticulitermitis]|uniref:Serine hydrolase domain-containing protein n=1 Tax=Gryllotalpicola reticulitermitis TaxID=1184153 RepID=A0ABV8Q8H6_9MICO
MSSGGGRRRGIRRAVAVLAVTLTAALLAGCSTTSDAPHVTAIGAKTGTRMPAAIAKQLQGVLDNAVKISGASGGIAGVWAPWSGTWTAASGTASKAKGSASVTTHSSFRIGSITKPATCTVLLDLVAAHKVKLTDRVSKYLPRMVGVNDVTLGELCDNTSGLADYWGALTPQIVTNPGRSWDPIELVNTALGESAPKAPGHTWSYSNAGFVLLGVALQAATGENWQHLYAKYVTDRLGISATTTLPTGTSLPSPMLRGYAADHDIVTGATECSTTVDDTALSPSALQTAGGLVSTLNDTASLIHAVASGALLPKGYAAQQQQARRISGSMPSWAKYGLGVETMGPLVGHASAVPGYSSAAYSDPTTGLTVVVVVNNSTPGANFARLVALELASIGSKAPPSQGKKLPALALPWSLSQLESVLPYETGCKAKAGKPSSGALAEIAAIGPRY